MSTWFLAIDFGTTNTCAAVVSDGGAVPVGFGPSQLARMPSGVLLRPDGGLLVGFEAERQAALHPERYDSSPKRSVGQATLLLGDREIPVVEAVAAVLAAAAAEARRQRGGTPPTKVALTYPARWGTTRQAVLRDAATRAGLGDVDLISEPEAAAAYFAKHDRIPVGRPIAVYDLGGGTLDVAVLTTTPSGFRVIGQPGGIDPCGGDDFDEGLLALTLERAAARVPGASALVTPDDVEWRSRRAALRTEVRRAKEDLATSDVTELVLPGLASTAELSRADLREAAGDDVDASVVEFLRTVALAGVALAHLAGIYLAGGSSRLPLVRESLSRRLPPETHRAVRTLNDPKAAVAQGAAEILHARENVPVEPTRVSGLVPAKGRPMIPKKYRVLAPVLAFVLAVVGAVVWLNFRDSNVVSGTVRTSDGEPMPDVELMLTGGLLGEQINTMTDANGRFTGKLPRGSYELTAYGTVAYEGQEVQILLSPRTAQSNVFDLPASGGVTLDLVFNASGQRPETTGATHLDYFGGVIQVIQTNPGESPIAPLNYLRPDGVVTFHFEPTAPTLVDGTPAEAFDVTRTIEELTGHSEQLGHNHMLEDIPLGSYVITATFTYPGGELPMGLAVGLNFTDSLSVPLAAFCAVDCTVPVVLTVGVDSSYLQ